MTRLKYLDPADGLYKLLPVGGGIPTPTEPTGFRNAVRNGDMQIAQRGDGPWTTVAYGIDGWRQGFGVGTGTSTCTRVPPSAGEMSGIVQEVISGQTGAGEYTMLYQNIEDVQTLQGRTVTVSFRARAASGTPKIAVELGQNFGSGGSATAYVVLGAVTLSTTMTRYSLTATLPSTTGKTIGSGNTLQLNLWFSAGATFAARASNIGLQSGTFQITDIQVEAGSVATPFERLPVQQQLAWCQRYFQRHWDPPLRGVFTSSTAAPRCGFSFPVPMRGAPTVVVTSLPWILDGVQEVQATSASGAKASATAMDLTLTVASGGVAARPCVVEIPNSPTCSIDFSAEL